MGARKPVHFGLQPEGRFPQPGHQNHLHMHALMAFPELPESAFHSIIFFIGDCQLKTPMPPDVLNRGLANGGDFWDVLCSNACRIIQLK